MNAHRLRGGIFRWRWWFHFQFQRGRPQISVPIVRRKAGVALDRPGGEGESDNSVIEADQATGQEQEAKEVLAKLDKLDAGDAEFEKLLGTFTESARKHIAFEETAVWPGLRTALNTERAAELGTQIAEGKKTAPTRPHPHTPPSPGAVWIPSRYSTVVLLR